MTNEQIFTMFLKKHRLYSAFNRNKEMEGTVNVRKAISSSFSWDYTPEGWSKWSNIDNKWLELCDTFYLKGIINLDKLRS